jgi:hypothetical protein
MSECVVRMKMPGCCWDCPCLDYDGDYPRCRISNEQRGFNFPIHEKRMPKCPITQPLPEGHGRLIDWDAYERIGFKLCRKTNEWKAELGTPTDKSYVVPAERSET